MAQKVLKWINYSLATCVGLLALLIFLMMVRSHEHVESLPAVESEKALLPRKNSFEQSSAAYNDIGSPVLSTSVVVPTLELPDLRPFLTYYGTNDRPDIAAKATLIYFSLKGADNVVGMSPGERLYMKYDASKRPGIYVFSPDNQSTNLWIEAEKEDNKANVHVHMVDDAGQPVTQPAIRSSFVLTAKDFARPGGTWEIGKWKVDGTLLARQRARWYGQDQFLNRHGGEEFADYKGRERIEFGDGNDRYVVYVKAGDCLIWDGQRWQRTTPGEASRAFPLMCVNKLDDRLMRLDLWDVGGQGHVSLNLVKSKEAWAPKTNELDFKFIATRTLSQYVFEVKKERMVLRPFDWLLLTDKGWKPLVSVEDIDGYVDRKTSGVLFIFDGPTHVDDKQALHATFYSPARTETYEINFPTDQASPILGGPRVEEKAGSSNEGGSGSSYEQPQEQSQQPIDEGGNEPYNTTPVEEEPTKERPNPKEPSTWVRPDTKTLQKLDETHPFGKDMEEAPIIPMKLPPSDEPSMQGEPQQEDQNGLYEPEAVPEDHGRANKREDSADNVVEAPSLRSVKSSGRLRQDIKYLLQEITK